MSLRINVCLVLYNVSVFFNWIDFFCDYVNTRITIMVVTIIIIIILTFQKPLATAMRKIDKLHSSFTGAQFASKRHDVLDVHSTSCVSLRTPLHRLA